MNIKLTILRNQIGGNSGNLTFRPGFIDIFWCPPASIPKSPKTSGNLAGAREWWAQGWAHQKKLQSAGANVRDTPPDGYAERIAALTMLDGMPGGRLTLAPIAGVTHAIL